MSHKLNNPYNHPMLKGFKAKTGTLEEKLAYIRNSKKNPENVAKLDALKAKKKYQA
jgi:hypothetical protein